MLVFPNLPAKINTILEVNTYRVFNLKPYLYIQLGYKESFKGLEFWINQNTLAYNFMSINGPRGNPKRFVPKTISYYKNINGSIIQNQ